MRKKLINYLKLHPTVVNIFWLLARMFLRIWGIFTPIRKKTILFASFGGRKFDDSPKAIYDEICSRSCFDDWDIIWAFVNPDEFQVNRGRKVKVDTLSFFHALLYSRVWVSNSGMDRGIGLKRKGCLKVETWHGTPLKKIGGEENQNSLGGKKKSKPRCKPDTKTIRCAQSEYDKQIFMRIFHADEKAFLLCDLPRNDALLCYTPSTCNEIKEKLGISRDKKVILYTPTYREYLINDNDDTYIAPPMNLKKWKEKLGEKYVLLVRAHYAVSAALNISEDAFVKDVSGYPCLNDLYAISDMMISDYSSTFFDYSILDRPMFCFAYDLEEYGQKRGLYLDIKKTLPCEIDKNEDEVLEHILNMDMELCIEKTKQFHKRFAPYAGKASKVVVDEMVSRLNET